MSRYEQLMEMIHQPGDECILWPYGQNGGGYGRLRHDGRNQSAHRLALDSVAPCPDPTLEAAHGPCHDSLCVNPTHLNWQTHAENMADRHRDRTVTALPGQANGRAKLTETDVIEIRQRCTNGETHPTLAAEFRVGLTAISNIVLRKRWAHVNSESEG